MNGYIPSLTYVWHTWEHIYAYVRTLGDVRMYDVYVPDVVVVVVVVVVVFFTSLRTWCVLTDDDCCADEGTPRRYCCNHTEIRKENTR